MDDALADPPWVQRNLILALLLALAAGAWTLLVWQSANTGMQSGDMDMTMTSSTMGMPAPLFLAIWVIMMVAMMFPTAAPMILTFHEVKAGRHKGGDAFVSTCVFVLAYILVWTLAGTAAYLGAVAAEALATRAELSSVATARIGGVILVAAGIYQLTPLKDLCLSKCRTPNNFIMMSWRDGAAGALRMGLLHGAYCLGCCWLLFVILFPLGIMNIGAMLAVTLIILAEKTLPWPRLAPYAAAFGLLLYGALVIVSPQLLLTFQEEGELGAWEHRGPILLIVATVLTQAALLIVLLHERQRRRHAEVLVTTIAHELNQPLTTILANSQAAEMLLLSSAPNLLEVREILSDIQRDDQRAVEVIRHFRSLSKKAAFERRDNDLNEIVRETIGFLSDMARSREADLGIEFASGELRIKGDRVQLQQVIINLIVNAIDAVSVVPRAKRKVTVATARVENFAEVAVSDTGPGIPIGNADVVFQPFFTTKPQGMGIGLYIARTITEAHGGRIWTKNQIGGGAVFHIRLPCSNTA